MWTDFASCLVHHRGYSIFVQDLSPEDDVSLLPWITSVMQDRDREEAEQSGGKQASCLMLDPLSCLICYIRDDSALLLMVCV